MRRDLTIRYFVGLVIVLSWNPRSIYTVLEVLRKECPIQFKVVKRNLSLVIKLLNLGQEKLSVDPTAKIRKCYFHCACDDAYAGIELFE